MRRTLVALAVLIPALASLVAWRQEPRRDWRVASSWWQPSWWLHPHDVNGFQRLPAFTRGINDITGAPGSGRLWAVGNGGLFAYSDDGGTTWERGDVLEPIGAAGALTAATAVSTSNGSPISAQAPSGSSAQVPVRQRLVRDSLRAMTAAYDSMTKAAARERELLRQGVSSPAQQKGPPLEGTDLLLERLGATIARLRSELNALSARGSSGQTASQQPRPAAAAIGGATARADSAPTATGTFSRDVTKVSFGDARRGWAIADRVVLATLDSGRTWRPLARRAPTELNDIETLPDGSAAIVGRGFAARVDSSGDLTIRGTPLENETANSRDVSFVAQRDGWIVSDSRVLRTRDGGATWSLAPKPAGRITALSFADSTNGWAIVEHGMLLATTNGGTTWSERGTSARQPLVAVYFIDRRRGWVVSAGGGLYATADGGATWVQRTSDARDFGRAFAALDARTAVTVGAGGTVLRTGDGGSTWTMQPSGTRKHLRAVRFIDNVRGVAVGDSGTLVRTVDAGRHWEPATIAGGSPSDDFASLVIVTGQTGYAFGRRGTELATGDGGLTWAPVANDLQHPTITAEYLASDLTFDLRRAAVDGIISDKVLLGPFPSEPARSGSMGEATAAAFSDPLHGWAVGSWGSIWRTADGAGSWTKQREDSTDALTFTSASFVSRARGWAAGTNGTLLTTGDSGKTWRGVTVQAPSDSQAVAVDFTRVVFTDSLHGWVAGAHGTIRMTSDGGRTWRAPDPPSHGMAPWYYAALLLAGVCLLPVLVPTRPQPAESVAERLVSDRPIRSTDPDALGFRDLADTIARFLLNTRTEPPLTIAITGEWGTGKSSLMGLLSEELVRLRFRPVAFNAWHHQKEEHLLAALLQSIRQQAVPPFLSRRGLLFRFRLIGLRTRRYWRGFAVAAALLVVWASLWVAHRELFAPAIRAVSSPSTLALLNNGEALITALGSLLLLPVPFIAAAATGLRLWRSVRAFGAKPASLLASVSSTARVKDLEAQTSFRYQFATEFREVTESLGSRPTVIFVDDLDRCRPNQVLEVLEAINFLVSSGNCFVVMGIDRERVVRCVGLGFKEVAEDLSDPVADGGAAVDRERRTREYREEYAKQYLEKLINIEIPVPRTSADGLRRVFSGEDVRGDAAEIPTRVPTRVRVTAWAAAAAVLFAAGIWTFERIPLPWLEQSAATAVADAPAWGAGRPMDSVAIPPGIVATAAGSSGRVISRGTARPHAATLAGVATVAAELVPARSGTHTHEGLYVAGLLAAAALALWTLAPRSEARIEDSAAFTTALAYFAPFVFKERHTPRGAKKYLNRVRFYAMRQRRLEPAPPVAAHLWQLSMHAWQVWKTAGLQWVEATGVRIRRPGVATVASSQASAGDGLAAHQTRSTTTEALATGEMAVPIPEPVLVALSTVQEYYPEWLRSSEPVDSLRARISDDLRQIDEDPHFKRLRRDAAYASARYHFANEFEWHLLELHRDRFNQMAKDTEVH